MKENEIVGNWEVPVDPMDPVWWAWVPALVAVAFLLGSRAWRTQPAHRPR